MVAIALAAAVFVGGVLMLVIEKQKRAFDHYWGSCYAASHQRISLDSEIKRLAADTRRGCSAYVLYLFLTRSASH
jgi:hypothetical protein